MAGMRHISKFYKEEQSGFTLLETLVVVLILAVIAGTVVTTFDSEVINEKQETAVEFEMMQIRDAVRKFIRDNPSFQLTDAFLCTPADASFLLDVEFDGDDDCERGEETVPDEEVDEFDDWDSDYRLGWQGPYLTTNATQYVDIGTNLQHDGTGSPLTGGPEEDVLAIADPFINEPVEVSPGVFFLQWRKVSGNTNSNMDKNGNPYLFFDLDDKALARIVSMGEDGIFNGNSSSSICEPRGDDYVLCIY